MTDEMTGKTCLVVLVGTNTSKRPWVKYEIEKAWKDKLGLVGIRIHGLRDLNTQSISTMGGNPFDGYQVNGTSLGSIVTLYDPPGTNSKQRYASINDNIDKLVTEAIKIRNKYG